MGAGPATPPPAGRAGRRFALLAVGLLLGTIPPGRATDPATGQAGEGGAVLVAVAANFANAARELTRRFEASTGHEVRLSLGSSGQLYAQIAQGAPFDAFLAADVERPRRAEEAGLAVAGTRFTYAVGRLVLFSRDPGRVVGPEALSRNDVTRVAIAHPENAPYGAAAVATMRALGLPSPPEGPALIRGNSVAQAYAFARTGNADLGFVAASQVAGESGGSLWLVPDSLHPPIEQQAVLLEAGRENRAARAFLDFLRSPAARRVIREHGYEEG